MIEYLLIYYKQIHRYFFYFLKNFREIKDRWKIEEFVLEVGAMENI